MSDVLVLEHHRRVSGVIITLIMMKAATSIVACNTVPGLVSRLSLFG
jgi:hypothetical protein